MAHLGSAPYIMEYATSPDGPRRKLGTLTDVRLSADDLQERIPGVRPWSISGVRFSVDAYRLVLAVAIAYAWEYQS